MEELRQQEEPIPEVIMPEKSLRGLFDRMHKTGAKTLKAVRAESNSPNETKISRTWNATEASALVGRSLPWLRERAGDIETDVRGIKRYTLKDIYDLRAEAGTEYKRPEGSEAAIIAISNFKGGVAKTTTTIHLAQRCAMVGLRVAVIDLDPQGSATFNLMNVVPDHDIAPEDLIGAALLEDPDEIQYVLKGSYFSNVFVAPTNVGLQDVERRLIDSPNSTALGHRYGRLQKALEVVRPEFDVIIIDCPPNMGALTANALVAADTFIIPLPPQAMDRASFVSYTDTLRNFFSAIPDKKMNLVRILITMHANTSAAKQEEHRIRSDFGDSVMEHVFFNSTEIGKASAVFSSIYDLEKPLNNRDTYRRALEIVDGVCDEIIDELKAVWDSQGGKK
mgnify:CR=1 FL=1